MNHTHFWSVNCAPWHPCHPSPHPWLWYFCDSSHGHKGQITLHCSQGAGNEQSRGRGMPSPKLNSWVQSTQNLFVGAKPGKIPCLSPQVASLSASITFPSGNKLDTSYSLYGPNHEDLSLFLFSLSSGKTPLFLWEFYLVCMSIVLNSYVAFGLHSHLLSETGCHSACWVQPQVNYLACCQAVCRGSSLALNLHLRIRCCS